MSSSKDVKSSQPRAEPVSPCIGRQLLIHRTTKGISATVGYSPCHFSFSFPPSGSDFRVILRIFSTEKMVSISHGGKPAFLPSLFSPSQHNCIEPLLLRYAAPGWMDAWDRASQRGTEVVPVIVKLPIHLAGGTGGISENQEQRNTRSQKN